ncbi:MAG: archaemetzincin [Thermodesulfobacteriota bacterium]|nr:archaemetzincin [Thermodesulfobacteriota bacterium]
MKSEDKIVAVQPLGDVRGAIVDTIASKIETFFNIRTDVFQGHAIPQGSYHPQRGQYNCYPILTFLRTLKPDHAIKTIGVTEVDLFVPILTYVFGEAEMGGHAAVISTYRLARGRDRQPIPAELLLKRVEKIAIHELAHTFCLSHCKEDGCLMGSFPILNRIDENSIRFCRYCVTFLRDEYESLGIAWRQDMATQHTNTP